MKITQKPQNKQYPYLAIMSLNKDIGDDKFKDTYNNDEIMLVSLSRKTPDDDEKPYVQYLNSWKPGWFTKNEDDYTPLPKNFEITLIQ